MGRDENTAGEYVDEETEFSAPMSTVDRTGRAIPTTNGKPAIMNGRRILVAVGVRGKVAIKIPKAATASPAPAKNPMNRSVAPRTNKAIGNRHRAMALRSAASRTHRVPRRTLIDPKESACAVAPFSPGSRLTFPPAGKSCE